MPPELLELLEYFTPLAGARYEAGGAVTLLTPGTNVLALNATYLPDLFMPDEAGACSTGEAPLWVSTRPGPVGGPVAALRLHELNEVGALPDAGVVVEQVSRLHLPEWCRVLALSHRTPGWAELLAVHFARVLEDRRDSVLLLAYRTGEAVGAALWRPTGPTGSALHLWGVLDAAAERPLLAAAGALGGGPLRYSRVVPPEEGQVFFRRV